MMSNNKPLKDMDGKEFWDRVVEELNHNKGFVDSVREALKYIDEKEKENNDKD